MSSKNSVSLAQFETYLIEEEKSAMTVEKYRRDVRVFLEYLDGRILTKGLVLEYKSNLLRSHAVSSANSMIAAVNAYLRFINRPELCVKQYKLQREAFCSNEKELTREEYRRLVTVADRRGNKRLSMIIQTICATGMRVSEIVYVDVESVKRGEIRVSCKGKTRTILIVKKLRQALLDYAKRVGIASGRIFVTRSGRSISRSAIWREMKTLCEAAKVIPAKVFPHNLRHLFARVFYGLEKDIAKLADILGHSSINTTRIYIVTTSTEHRRKMENMHLMI